MTIISEIARAIARDPSINRVIVSERERKLLREEFIDLDPQTFGATRERRKLILAATRFAKIMIMGREVLTRNERGGER